MTLLLVRRTTVALQILNDLAAGIGRLDAARIVVADLFARLNIPDGEHGEMRHVVVDADGHHVQVRLAGVIDEPADVADQRRIDVGDEHAVSGVLADGQDVVRLAVGSRLRPIPGHLQRDDLSGGTRSSASTPDVVLTPDAEALLLGGEDLQLGAHAVLDDPVLAGRRTRTRPAAFVDRLHLLRIGIEVRQAAILVVHPAEAGDTMAGVVAEPVTVAATADEDVFEQAAGSTRTGYIISDILEDDKDIKTDINNNNETFCGNSYYGGRLRNPTTVTRLVAAPVRGRFRLTIRQYEHRYLITTRERRNRNLKLLPTDPGWHGRVENDFG